VGTQEASPEVVLAVAVDPQGAAAGVAEVVDRFD
jgi:hypothetical protein